MLASAMTQCTIIKVLSGSGVLIIMSYSTALTSMTSSKNALNPIETWSTVGKTGTKGVITEVVHDKEPLAVLVMCEITTKE